MVAIKVAPFNRYATLEVARALADSGRAGEVALYTGNDDAIVADLLADLDFGGAPASPVRRAASSGQWAVWTRKAVALLEEVRSLSRADGGERVHRLLTLGHQLTDANAALFDARNGFAGCIAGLHEILRRQGLLAGRWCLDPKRGPLAGPGGGDRPRPARLPAPDRRRLRGREPRPVAAMTASRPGHPRLLDVVPRPEAGRAAGPLLRLLRQPLRPRSLDAPGPKADGGIVCIESTSNQVNPDGRLYRPDPGALRRVPSATSRAPWTFPSSASSWVAITSAPSRGQTRDRRRSRWRRRGRRCASTCSRASRRSTSTPACGAPTTPPGRPLPDRGHRAHGRSVRRGRGRASPSARRAHPLPLYVVGTEVPAPGGEQEQPWPSRSHAGRGRAARPSISPAPPSRRGVSRPRGNGWWASWSNPESSSATPTVFEYDRPAAARLRAFIEGLDGSSSRPTPPTTRPRALLRALVEDHFAILKVGPALTFAFREAVFALADDRARVAGAPQGRRPLRHRTVLEDGHAREAGGTGSATTTATPTRLRFARRFSLSDRIRYYWAQPPVAAALRRLLDNLRSTPRRRQRSSSQYVPVQNAALARGRDRRRSAGPRPPTRSWRSRRPTRAPVAATLGRDRGEPDRATRAEEAPDRMLRCAPCARDVRGFGP